VVSLICFCYVLGGLLFESYVGGEVVASVMTLILDEDGLKELVTAIPAT
jgi:hypothetical protein